MSAYIQKDVSLINHILVTFITGVKSLFYSRKWLIYIFLSLTPILFSLVSSRRLGGASTPLEAFLQITIGMQYGFFYVFGVLLLALPFTSDEISDHIMDLYIIRPVYREVIFFTRYFILVIANTIITSALVIIYYVYFYAIDGKNMFNGTDLKKLGGIIIFFAVANILYSALFFGIGLLGSKGFGIGIFVAIFELYFLNLLFLTGNAFIPRTNLNIIGEKLIGTNDFLQHVPGGNFINYTNNTIPGLSNYYNAIVYIIVASIILLVVGLFYLKQREFD